MAGTGSWRAAFALLLILGACGPGKPAHTGAARCADLPAAEAAAARVLRRDALHLFSMGRYDEAEAIGKQLTGMCSNERIDAMLAQIPTKRAERDLQEDLDQRTDLRAQEAAEAQQQCPADVARIHDRAAAACEYLCAAREYDCNLLAEMYEVGIGIAKDERKAAVLLQRACNDRNASACFYLNSSRQQVLDDMNFPNNKGRLPPTSLGWRSEWALNCCETDGARSLAYAMRAGLHEAGGACLERYRHEAKCFRTRYEERLRLIPLLRDWGRQHVAVHLSYDERQTKICTNYVHTSVPCGSAAAVNWFLEGSVAHAGSVSNRSAIPLRCALYIGSSRVDEEEVRPGQTRKLRHVYHLVMPELRNLTRALGGRDVELPSNITCFGDVTRAGIESSIAWTGFRYLEDRAGNTGADVTPLPDEELTLTRGSWDCPAWSDKSKIKAD